jgi:AcrR family transcriptional regulator
MEGQSMEGQSMEGQSMEGQSASKEDAVPASGFRPRRADARRNRERLLETAVRAFAEGDTDVTLESIARDAGVGIGTLYRHFPTRDALVEAAYRSELAKLCEAAPDLLRSAPPEVALRRWLDRFVRHLEAKRGMAGALRAVVASGGQPFSETRAGLLGAIDTLLSAGARAGTLRSDVAPMDVLVSVSGILLVAGAPDQREQADRLLDLLVDGLRYGAAPAP